MHEWDESAAAPVLSALKLTAVRGLRPRWNGTVDGAFVELRHHVRGESPVGLTVIAWREFPSDLGLSVHQSGGFLMREASLSTGDASFDTLFATRGCADDVDLIPQQLDPEVRAGLLQQGVLSHPSLSDLAAVCQFPVDTLTPDEVIGRVRACVALAHTADRAAEKLDAPQRLRLDGTASAAARRAASLGLTARMNQLSARGALAHATVAFSVRTTERAELWGDIIDQSVSPGVKLTAVATAPLGFSLRVSPAKLRDRLLDFVHAGDLKTGDAAFDRAFTIVTNDGDAALRALNPEVRKTLSQMLSLGLVPTLDGERFEARGPVPEHAESLPQSLELVAGLFDAMRGPNPLPYR